jgi:hypothetical protein
MVVVCFWMLPSGNGMCCTTECSLIIHDTPKGDNCMNDYMSITAQALFAESG